MKEKQDVFQETLAFEYRKEWCEKAGVGFELGELGYKMLAPIRPSRPSMDGF